MITEDWLIVGIGQDDLQQLGNEGCAPDEDDRGNCAVIAPLQQSDQTD
jgi:hypothetical protein